MFKKIEKCSSENVFIYIYVYSSPEQINLFKKRWNLDQTMFNCLSKKVYTLADLKLHVFTVNFPTRLNYNLITHAKIHQ